jgi:hypothetical protein
MKLTRSRRWRRPDSELADNPAALTVRVAEGLVKPARRVALVEPAGFAPGSASGCRYRAFCALNVLPTSLCEFHP